MSELSALPCPAQWQDFQPNMLATLMFVLQGDDILLIRKKRGLGAGKINGPGGKIEPGETPLEAAIRETQEEVGITPLNPEEIGILHFQFTNGLAIKCHVFSTESYTGELKETDEATPFWTQQKAIPYEEMWADDQFWLPFVLKETPFLAYFEFNEETMLSSMIVTGGD